MTLSKMASILALGMTLGACGGGGGGSAPPPVATQDPVKPIGAAGVFDVNYNQFTGVYTFLENGEFYGLHFVAGELAGHPHGKLTKAATDASKESIAWANFIDDAAKVGAQEPAGMFGRAFSGTTLNVSISGSMGSFTATTSKQSPYTTGSSKTLFADALPLPVLAGGYTGIVRTAGFGKPMEQVSAFTIGASGAVSASVAGCSLTGNITQHGSTGIYDAQMATGGGASCGWAGALKGIVVPLVVLGNTQTLAFQVNSLDNKMSVVFIVTKN